jgi:hypothetical protein
MVENEEGKMNVGGIATCRENVFEAIDEWHRGNSHLGSERTWTYCKNTYWNVSQEHVRIYLKTCLTCMKKNPVTITFKGSCKPIFSKSFCDRFQLDIINFRAPRKCNPIGVLMHGVLTIKDHAIGLMYLCALPRKYPDLVAYKLQEIFGVISYPKIFHRDNGKEFTAKLILQFLCAMNPNILTVTGRPRRPHDQGFIENMNKFVERVLVMVLAERRLAGENPNWTKVLGSVAAPIKLQHGCGKNNVSSYKAVFGHEFNNKFACSKEEARRCWTLDETMGVTNDKEFEEYVQEYFVLNHKGIIVASDDDEDDDLSYFPTMRSQLIRLMRWMTNILMSISWIILKQHQLLRRPRVQRTRSPP